MAKQTNEPDPAEEGVIHEYYFDPRNDPERKFKGKGTVEEEKRKEEEHEQAMEEKGYNVGGEFEGREGEPKEPKEGEDADESPLSDTNAPEAIDQISRMRNADRLQSIANSDKRSSVKDAARRRLAELKG